MLDQNLAIFEGCFGATCAGDTGLTGEWPNIIMCELVGHRNQETTLGRGQGWFLFGSSHRNAVLGSRASDAVYTELLDVGLPNLVAKPCWTVCRCSYLLAPSLEHVYAVGSTLAKRDLGVAARCSLESGATRLPRSEDDVGILALFLEHEVLLISHCIFPVWTVQ